ncbi:hypothetical protein T190_02405 [Sinorhizobium meliloti CCBAU 01290]|nr:hypothetical protein T190_02405 [Sinorhizobium meliloti CCBAU 01290]
MTTITERSFRETAKLSSFEAGGAVDFSIGGQASLSLYHQAGVDPANPGDLYPEELLAIAGLAFIEAGLANEYFYDKQVALSPAFKALVAVAVANFVAPAIVGTVLPVSAAGPWPPPKPSLPPSSSRASTASSRATTTSARSSRAPPSPVPPRG